MVISRASNVDSNNISLKKIKQDNKFISQVKMDQSIIIDKQQKEDIIKFAEKLIKNFPNASNYIKKNQTEVLQNIKTLHDNGVSWEKIEKLIFLSGDNADEVIDLIIDEKSKNGNKSFDEIVNALIKAKQTVKQSGAGNQYDEAMENMLERTIFLEELGYSKDEIRQRLGKSIEQANKSGKITKEEYQYWNDLLANDELWNQFYEQVQQMVSTFADINKIQDEKMLLEKQEQIEKTISNVNHGYFSNQPNTQVESVLDKAKKNMLIEDKQRFVQLEKMLDQIKNDDLQLARYSQAQKKELANLDKKMQSTKEFLLELENIMETQLVNNSRFLTETLKKRAELGKQIVLKQDPEAIDALKEEIRERDELLKELDQTREKVFLAGEMFVTSNFEKIDNFLAELR